MQDKTLTKKTQPEKDQETDVKSVEVERTVIENKPAKTSKTETTVSNPRKLNIPETPNKVKEDSGEERLAKFKAHILDKGSLHDSLALDQLDTFVKTMGPTKNTTDSEARTAIFRFWKFLRGQLESSPMDGFSLRWRAIMAYFYAYRETAFHETIIFQQAEGWGGPVSHLRAFQGLLNLLKVTSDLSLTHAQRRSQVNLNSELLSGLSEAGKNRLINFYSGSNW